MKSNKNEKCIIVGCENHQNQGRFVGRLCMPCYEFLVNDSGIYSQAYRNKRVKDELEILIQEFGIELVELILKTMTGKEIKDIQNRKSKHELENFEFTTLANWYEDTRKDNYNRDLSDDEQRILDADVSEITTPDKLNYFYSDYVPLSVFSGQTLRYESSRVKIVDTGETKDVKLVYVFGRWGMLMENTEIIWLYKPEEVEILSQSS